LIATANADGSTTRYVHGLGLLYEETTPAGGGNATTQFYHFNWQGSTVALTDASGNVTARMAYSAYGEVTIEGGSGFQLPSTLPTPFLFNGQFGVLTEPHGLYAMQARFYSPVFRRFLSEDPAGFAGGLNLYAYANGDPVNLMDPFGLGPATSFWNHGIGAIMEGAADGFRQGLDNLNNTLTFGLYDHMGWSRSYENVGWEHDLGRSLAAVPRDLALAATAGAAASAARQGATSALSALTNRASLAAGPSLPQGGAQIVHVGEVGTLQQGSFVNRVYDSRFGQPGAQVSGPLGRSFTPGSGVPTTAGEAIQQRGLNLFYPNNAERAVIYRATGDIPTINRTSIGGSAPETLIDPRYFDRLDKIREVSLPR